MDPSAMPVQTFGGFMKLALTFVALLAVVGRAGAQTPQGAQRIVGDRISGQMHLDARTRMTIETATLTFPGRDGGPTYTIDFTARHLVNEPVVSPGVVDIVVTQHPVEDDAPEMMLRVDGETMPIVTRLHSKRSVVASVSLEAFDRIARAGTVVDRSFDTELELGPGQARMLRSTADRWMGRVR
jgi:hypothetical protein